jgi:hypothetical protein
MARNLTHVPATGVTLNRDATVAVLKYAGKGVCAHVLWHVHITISRATHAGRTTDAVG